MLIASKFTAKSILLRKENPLNDYLYLHYSEFQLIAVNHFRSLLDCITIPKITLLMKL